MRTKALKSLKPEQKFQLLYDWRWWARPNQLRPGTPGAAIERKDWSFWLALSGRGWGKTRVGAETVREWVAGGKKLIHIVAATAADARDVMIQGPSGLLSCFPPGRRPNYEPSKRLVTFPGGAQAHLFSADEPERLRGPQCECFWADELAAWRFGQEAWDNLMFGFRLGNDLRGVITTTPKPIALVRALIDDPQTVVTRASTYENRGNLAPEFFSSIIKKYEGTRIGRQELMGEVLADIPGALWTRAMIDAAKMPMDKMPMLDRVVIAIDPAVTSSETSDETGIGAIGMSGTHLYVLEDVSIRGTPNEWARAALKLFLKWNADRLVAEVNNGGDLVEANLRAVHPGVPYRALRATRGKAIRAEPVSALYEQGRVHHVGTGLEALEDQLCNWTPQSGEKSPDRMDWLVWGAYDLMISPSEQHLISVSGYNPSISPI